MPAANQGTCCFLGGGSFCPASDAGGVRCLDHGAEKCALPVFLPALPVHLSQLCRCRRGASRLEEVVVLCGIAVFLPACIVQQNRKRFSPCRDTADPLVAAWQREAKGGCSPCAVLRAGDPPRQTDGAAGGFARSGKGG